MEQCKTAIGPSEGPAGGSADASRPLPRGGKDFALRFIGDTLFFGLIGLFLWSWFPIALGAFLFFTKDEFFVWVLEKIGIRVVPDAFGAALISALVWLTGAWALLAYWRDSAPAWLSPWLPPSLPWPAVGAIALGCAALATISAAVIRKLLPWVGIEIPRDSVAWTITWGLIGFSILGMLALLTGMVSD
jgi:hypothetical protein